MLDTIMAADQQANASPIDPTMLILLAVFAVFIFMMFRKQKKTKAAMEEQRSQMVAGTEVMTQFGLFGTILSVDQENNKAVLELSPGNTATVHLQVLTKVVTPEPSPEIPDDASSLTESDITDISDATDENRKRDNG